MLSSLSCHVEAQGKNLLPNPFSLLFKSSSLYCTCKLSGLAGYQLNCSQLLETAWIPCLKDLSIFKTSRDSPLHHILPLLHVSDFLSDLYTQM